ncbi:Aldehyde dehydrogenase, partial [Blyttiomyces sp. JEL0837]
IVASARSAYELGVTKPISWRRAQIKALYDFIQDKESLIAEALYKDQRRDQGTTFWGEVLFTLNEAAHALNKLDEWVQPERPEVGYLQAADKCEIRHDPLGLVLIVGPWNYP